MSSLDFIFDPTGENAANLITNEIQTIDLTTDLMVMPVNHPFFAESMPTVTVTDGTNTKTLSRGIGYILGPIFVEAGARTTGKMVCSYIVITDNTYPWNSITMNYQTLGGYQDTYLLSELAATTIDRSIRSEWLKIKGGAAFFEVYQRNPQLATDSMLSVLAGGVADIANILNAPASSNTQWGQRISAIETLIASGGAGGSGGISAKPTAMDMTITQDITVADKAVYLIDRVSVLNSAIDTKKLTMVTPTVTGTARDTISLPSANFTGTLTSDEGYPWWIDSAATITLCRIGGRWFYYSTDLTTVYVSDYGFEMPTQADTWSLYNLGINTDMSDAVATGTVAEAFTYYPVTLTVAAGFEGGFYVGDFLGSMALGSNTLKTLNHVGLGAPDGTVKFTEPGEFTYFYADPKTIRPHFHGMVPQ